MSVPRFFVSPWNDQRVTLPAAEARHAVQSLRLRTGEAVELLDGRGNVGHGTLAVDEPPGRKAPPTVHVALSKTVSHRAVQPPLHLYVAGCKGPRLAWLVEKCTELGVTAIHFTRYARSVVTVGDNQVRKLERTATEACKQCGNPWLPQITNGQSASQLIDAAEAAPLCIAHPGAGSLPFADWLSTAPAAGGEPLALCIGPEGGFSDEECEQFRLKGAAQVTLGPHVLRVETAAVAATAAWSMAAR